jgi:D-serine deaminase-like pyridoxal phosphate-dependent protein
MLETPHLLIDGVKMRRNIEKIAGVARECRVKLRPHVKTHEISSIAREQLNVGAVGSRWRRSPRQRPWLIWGRGTVLVERESK